MKIDFNTIAYLQQGSKVQQQVYHTLTSHRILELLAAFNPVVVGTFPLDIAIETSDIDIACQLEDVEVFQSIVQNHFGSCTGFSDLVFEMRKQQTYVANFVLDDFPIELFAQAIPVSAQYGYRHMLIEDEILREQGPIFKAQIIALKREGIKTEPAFAKLLGLKGDPYENLLLYGTKKT
ncbi:DUF4269 domain-containing protein [Myroides sp. 1354]|uniref:DUF4269 domain-containing protein n=1 Tax=unclassified Myroides TaxID=2642485 RepID=UPI002576C657|nr:MULTISPECIES: DUF4269 domain-containing protein [unclassified Myroides]MDM1045302.1 DUF4269 domain-containing protein [Myroides sp. R163-1]MDM1056184.1 DUF4269 domain-containing protein [Myroides sp. 1354]MDM1069313.1 DUF4269 domain-containing protein [Myroides sp. 1372]